MKRLMLAAIAASMFLPAPAPAQVGVQIHVNVPVNPPLVVVQPGIQVVEDWDEEVFYTGGFYWVHRDGYWYRATSPRARWVYVEPRRVPPGLMRMPPGQYKHYRGKGWKEHRGGPPGKFGGPPGRGPPGRGGGHGHGHGD